MHNVIWNNLFKSLDQTTTLRCPPGCIQANNSKESHLLIYFLYKNVDTCESVANVTGSFLLTYINFNFFFL